MKIGSFLSATIGYVVVTFLLAVVWHVVLFKSTYEQLGYFGKDPSFALGFLSILTQGLMLAYLFPLFSKGESPYQEGLRFSLVIGIFLWSCHVLAAAAKQDISPISTFLMMETLYLALQFTLAGMILGAAYRSGSDSFTRIPSSPKIQ